MPTSKRSAEHFAPLEPRRLLAVTPVATNLILSTDGIDKFVFYNSANGSTKSITAPMNEPKFASLSPDRTKILCTGHIGNNFSTEEIFTCNADGTGLKQLTSNSSQDTEPAFSSDGSRIAFVSARDGNEDLFVMNADGTNQMRLTTDTGTDATPQFSPDGTRIVFTNDSPGEPEILTVNSTDGGGFMRVINNGLFDIDPVYSPDGERIAYAQGGNIWVIAAPGSAAAALPPIQITDTSKLTATGDSQPVFSPDGTQIAFDRNESTGGNFLETASADESVGSITQVVQSTSLFPGLSWASAPTFAGQFHGLIFVNGTAGGDAISFIHNGLNLQFTLNGKSESFSTDHFTGIEIFAGAGNDTVDGSQGDVDFYVSGDAGNDDLIGGPFNDTLTGGAGKNTLNGNDGNDRLNGSGGHDYLYGDNGNDFLYGNGGDDYMVGGAGLDHMWGGDGNDQLYGNNGNDKMYGEVGDDVIVGGAGNDLLSGGPGADTINGQAGTDSAISTDSSNVISGVEVLP